MEPMSYGSENELIEGFEHGIVERTIKKEKNL